MSTEFHVAPIKASWRDLSPHHSPRAKDPINLVFLLFVLAAFYSQNTFAQARLMGAVQEIVDGGQRYEQYTVKCGTIEKRKLVRRPLGTEMWCDSRTGTFCAEGRVPTAHLVCSQDYLTKVEQLDPTTNSSQQNSAPVTSKSPQQVALEREMRQIESEMIDIEARKLELRNKELALLKQEAQLSQTN